MITVRQIERLWNARDYSRMLSLLMDVRPETSLRAATELAKAIPVAAMAVIRLDELNQSSAAVYGRMIRTILCGQERTGGFGNPMVTALCLRALMCGCGFGSAIERGLGYLAWLQGPEGLWPREPEHCSAGDPYVTAFILHQLADDARFVEMIPTEGTFAWFRWHESVLDGDTARLWRSIMSRRAVGRGFSVGRLEKAWR